jgi:hypothetical protein
LSSRILNHTVPFFDILYLFTCVLKIFLFGIICVSFQFIPQLSIVFPAFFIIDILLFPSCIHFTDHFLCNPRVSCSLSVFPTKSPTVFQTNIISSTNFTAKTLKVYFTYYIFSCTVYSTEKDV